MHWQWDLVDLPPRATYGTVAIAVGQKLVDRQPRPLFAQDDQVSIGIGADVADLLFEAAIAVGAEFC